MTRGTGRGSGRSTRGGGVEAGSVGGPGGSTRSGEVGSLAGSVGGPDRATARSAANITGTVPRAGRLRVSGGSRGGPGDHAREAGGALGPVGEYGRGHGPCRGCP